MRQGDKVIEPTEGDSSPRMRRSRVVLPPPLGPVMATKSLALIEKFTSRKIVRRPSVMDTSERLIICDEGIYDKV